MSCQYAILRHEGVARPHFDVMFQSEPGGRLHTWGAEIWPPAGAVVLEQLVDHRAAYLTFEGDISSNRGTVRRIEQGKCEVLEHADGKWLMRFTPAPNGTPIILEFKREVASAQPDRWRCQPAGPVR